MGLLHWRYFKGGSTHEVVKEQRAPKVSNPVKAKWIIQLDDTNHIFQNVITIQQSENWFSGLASTPDYHTLRSTKTIAKNKEKIGQVYCHL